MKQAEKTDMLLALIRERKPMTVAQQLQLTVYLSIPAIGSFSSRSSAAFRSSMILSITSLAGSSFAVFLSNVVR